MMNADNPIPTEKKLLMTYRLEPGCLGPDGEDYIEDFCIYVTAAFMERKSSFAIYRFVPRYNKTLTEIEFSVNHKRLSEAKAGQYINFFGQTLIGFEEDLQNQLTRLVDSFFER
jgi:hypothetical protein